MALIKNRLTPLVIRDSIMQILRFFGRTGNWCALPEGCQFNSCELMSYKSEVKDLPLPYLHAIIHHTLLWSAFSDQVFPAPSVFHRHVLAPQSRHHSRSWFICHLRPFIFTQTGRMYRSIHGVYTQASSDLFLNCFITYSMCDHYIMPWSNDDHRHQLRLVKNAYPSL